MVTAMADKYVYPYSSVEAKRLGELDEWRTSHRLNKECAAAIDKDVRERFDGLNLPGDVAENACREFDIDRVKWVLANTVQHADWDGRFRPHNKEWAAKTYIPRNAQNDNTTEFVLNSHPEIVNGLVDQYRRFYDSLNLFDKSHCTPGSCDMDYQGKVLILDPSILKDECKTPYDQLFYANVGGFGCKPDNHGKVMGTFLSDGEKTNFHRDDFLGIINEKYLPDWAKEKLAEFESPTEDQDEGMTMQ